MFNGNESFSSNGFIYDPYNDIRPITGANALTTGTGSSAKKKKKGGKLKEGSSAAYEQLKQEAVRLH